MAANLVTNENARRARERAKSVRKRPLNEILMLEKLRLHIFEPCFRARETGGLSMYPWGVKFSTRALGDPTRPMAMRRFSYSQRALMKRDWHAEVSTPARRYITGSFKLSGALPGTFAVQPQSAITSYSRAMFSRTRLTSCDDRLASERHILSSTRYETFSR